MAYGCAKGINFIERSLTLIDNAAKIASSYNGRLFGDFVFDVVVSRMKNPDCGIAYTQVNIWFNNQSDADKFVNEMKLLGAKINTKNDLIIIKHFDSLFINILLAYYIIEISETLVVNYPSDNYQFYYANEEKKILITDIIPKNSEDFKEGKHLFYEKK